MKAKLILELNYNKETYSITKSHLPLLELIHFHLASVTIYLMAESINGDQFIKKKVSAVV